MVPSLHLSMIRLFAAFGYTGTNKNMDCAMAQAYLIVLAPPTRARTKMLAEGQRGASGTPSEIQMIS